jgi:hypothetical protein
MSGDRERRIDLLASRVKGLRQAVRLDNFRWAQRLRLGLAAHLKDFKGPLRDDVALLFEISGLWVRNVGDRHDAKRQVQRIIRRVIPRLKTRYRRRKIGRGFPSNTHLEIGK